MSGSWHGNCNSPNTNQHPTRLAAHNSANAIHTKMEIGNDTHSKYGTHDVRSASHRPRLLGDLGLHPVKPYRKNRKTARLTETHNGTRSLHPFAHSVCGQYQFPYFVSEHLYRPLLASRLFPPALYAYRHDKDWEYAYFFWVKVFALTFALGVVSGITMSFQFGTNWPGFMERVGNIAGPLLGYEVLTAFFLEASFLGIMLYGKNLVSNRVHLISSFLVAIGTTTSAFWILSLNSWMHTPAGFTIENGVFMVDDWMEIIFNPSFKYRFIHTVTASLLTSAFFVAGISAWRARKNVDGPATWKVHAHRSRTCCHCCAHSDFCRRPAWAGSA